MQKLIQRIKQNPKLAATVALCVIAYALLHWV